MNTNYGHLENGTLVYAKNIVQIDNRTYINPSAETYLKCNPPEKLIDRSSPQEPPPEGHHYEASGYTETDTEVHVHWVVVEDTPVPQPSGRVFSKMYLELALFKSGLLPAVDDFIDSQTITNEQGQTMPLRRLYDTALTFSEDNEYFSQFKTAIQQTLGVSDEQLEEILSASVAKSEYM